MADLEIAEERIEQQAVIRLLETRAERAERAADALAEGLREITYAFARMPDAGFNNDDPRWAWWHETFEARKRARDLLAEHGEKP